MKSKINAALFCKKLHTRKKADIEPKGIFLHKITFILNTKAEEHGGAEDLEQSKLAIQSVFLGVYNYVFSLSAPLPFLLCFL